MWGVYLDDANQYRFRIYGPSGRQIAASSEAYKELHECRDAMDQTAKAVFESICYGGIAPIAVKEDYE